MEDCELIVRLKGKDIFSAGWNDICISSNEEDINVIYTIINKYDNYLSGVISGIKHGNKIKKSKN